MNNAMPPVHGPAVDTGEPPGARVHSRWLLGLTALPVTVECHVGRGLPGTTIVGLPQSSVREARDRVKSALLNTGFDYPDGNIVINLAPGDLAKSGTSLDLPIAISLLTATRQIPDFTRRYEFVGELGLFGEIRRINGAVAFALAASRAGRQLVAPAANLPELQVARGIAIGIAENLRQLTQALSGSHPLADASAAAPAQTPASPPAAAVVGQQTAKRALTVAAAGGHHALMVGPPGTGKTMLARGFAALLPPLSEQQSLEVASIYSAAGLQRQDYAAAPFRDPHHSASAPALVGGGNPPAPGEVALAHQGVLFLDELPHFKPSALNLLREPIETGTAVITRANYKVTFPCRFQLIAAMNPCPAGRSCREDACRCSPAQVLRYQSRISGPLLDRIDIQVRVPALSEQLLTRLGRENASQDADQAGREYAQQQQRVAGARQAQMLRQQQVNAELSGPALDRQIRAAQVDEQYLAAAVQRFQLSARSFHKLWRIARTIADLDNEDVIQRPHLTEALTYRSLNWEEGVT